MYITVRFNDVLNNRNRAVKNFCLLIIIYIHCFCLPLVQGALNKFINDKSSKCYELLNLKNKCNDSFVEVKTFFLQMFLVKKQAVYNSLFKCISCKTVSS